MSIETYMWDCIEKCPGAMVAWYLMNSYLYYELDRPVVSDAAYDKLCRMLYDHWDDVDHWHKPYVNRESLLAGTGFQLVYPERTKSAAEHLLDFGKAKNSS